MGSEQGILRGSYPDFCSSNPGIGQRDGIGIGSLRKMTAGPVGDALLMLFAVAMVGWARRWADRLSDEEAPDPTEALDAPRRRDGLGRELAGLPDRGAESQTPAPAGAGIDPG